MNICQISLSYWLNLNPDVVVSSNQLGERVNHQQQHSSIIIYFKNYKVLSIINNNIINMWCVHCLAVITLCKPVV